MKFGRAVKPEIPEIENAIPNKLLDIQFLDVRYIDIGSIVIVNVARLNLVIYRGNSLTKKIKLNLSTRLTIKVDVKSLEKYLSVQSSMMLIRQKTYIYANLYPHQRKKSREQYL